MKNERIYQALGEVDDELLERCEVHVAARRRPVWVRLGAMAACLCLVVLGSIAIRQHGVSSTPEIIAFGINGSESISGYYSTPENGSVLLFPDVQGALQANAETKDALYFVSISLSRDGVPLASDNVAVQAQLQRLAQAGYQIGYAQSWTYQGEGEKVNVIYPAGFLTRTQIENFDTGNDYGWSISFATNGDGSPVSTDQSLSTVYPAESNKK